MRGFGRKRPLTGAVRKKECPCGARIAPRGPPRGHAARSAEKERPKGPRLKGHTPAPGASPGGVAGWLYYQYCFFTFLVYHSPLDLSNTPNLLQ